MKISTLRPLLVALPLALLAVQAQAHTGQGNMNGFLSGFEHPILGWDHVVAMVAVGLWGAFLGGAAIWTLPVVFPMIMAFGGALGIVGIPLPGIETGIAVSGIVLGLLVALAVRAPLVIASVIVGVFAIFHGYAHGAELPEATNPFAYGIGFVVGTGLLHLCGIAIGFLTWTAPGRFFVRGLGVLIAGVGGAFLFGYA